MKFPDPKPQQQFKFTDAQKEDLLKSWIKSDDDVVNTVFLNKIESSISFWLFMSRRQRPNQKTLNKELSNIQKQAGLLIKTLNESRSVTRLWLDGQKNKFLFVRENKAQNHALLQNYHAMLEKMLELISTSASELISRRIGLNFRVRKKLQKQSEILCKALSVAHPETIRWLAVNTDFFVNKEKADKFSLIRYYMKNQVLLKNYLPLLEQMLILIESSSSDLLLQRSEMKLKSKNRWEKNLVYLLAVDYENYFAEENDQGRDQDRRLKKPGFSTSGKGTPFMRIINKLSLILNVQIGEGTIREVLSTF